MNTEQSAHSLRPPGVAVGRNQPPARFVTADRAASRDPLDLHARADDLLTLETGWLDGEAGVPLDPAEVRPFVASLTAIYPDDLPLPYLFPTAEGNVRLEWSLPPWDVSLDIDFAAAVGTVHALNLATNEDTEATVAFRHAAAWRPVFDQLRRFAEARVTAVAGGGVSGRVRRRA